MLGLGGGEILAGLLLLKAGVTFLWQEYQKGQQAFLKILGQAQTKTAQNLSDALGELVARGKNKGIDSYELYRNLEKLLPLLCLDASHQRVEALVYSASLELLGRQKGAWVDKKRSLAKSDARQMKALLLWNPECAEVFEATKGNTELTVLDVSKMEKFPGDLTAGLVSYLVPIPWGQSRSLTRKARADAEQVFHNSVGGVFDWAKEIHDTQREFAAALCEAGALYQSYVPGDSGTAYRKWREAVKLRDKLLELSETNPQDRIIRFKFDYYIPKNEVRDEWQKAAYPVLLLIARFRRSPVLDRRKREIDALFDAVGATDAEREEIKVRINSLYGAIHRRWSADGWIKRATDDVRYNASPFFDYRFRGWRKATSKRRVLFLQHYDLFQFKSPRQLTEEGVLGLVQTMEAHEDTVFVRESRLNSELQQIYNRAVNNERHGKFDAAIADLKSLLHRVSEASGPNAVDYPDETLSAIHCYLACIYASRGEHLEEAVEFAERAMRIHDTWLTRLAIGWSYHQLGKVPAAIKALEAAKAEAMHAGSGLLPLVHLVLGDAYRDAERHQDAEEAWREGWELADDPAWKDQAELTPFEVKERADLRRKLGERLGLENSLL